MCTYNREDIYLHKKAELIQNVGTLMAEDYMSDKGSTIPSVSQIEKFLAFRCCVGH